MPRTESFPIGALGLCLLAIACQQDAVIASNCTEARCAQSEALLTVSGSVDIEAAGGREPLTPAIAFFNTEQSRFHIIDVEVEGTFPSDFIVRVHQPPPQEALLEGPTGSPWAIGYLTAIAQDHPESVRFGVWEPAYDLNDRTGMGCWSQDEEGWASSGATVERPCPIVWRWCTVTGDECYVEKRWCREEYWPGSSEREDDCVVEWSEGDPDLSRDPWDTFAGLSEELVVVYLVDALEPDDPGARALDELPLDAGYHLMQLATPDAAERAARDMCQQEAEALATDRYNEEHGTDFGSFPGEFIIEALAELSCPPSEVALRVADNEGVSVRIAPDVSPLGEPYGGAPSVPGVNVAPPPPTTPPLDAE